MRLASHSQHNTPYWRIWGASPLFFSCAQLGAQLNTAGNQFYGLAVGGALMISAMSVGSISGAALNFAVWFGAIVAAWIDDDGVQSKHAWIYVIAPALG